MLTESTFFRSIARFVTGALLIHCIPVASFGKNVQDIVKSMEVKNPLKPSRTLTASEIKKMSGRVGANPYLAGSSPWSVNVEGVDMVTGNYSMSATDLSYEGGYGVPVAISRSYSMNNPDEGPLGYGWTLSVDVRTTAGGVLKSPGSPVRSVPVNMRERPTSERVQVATTGQTILEPVDAVIATDASGNEQTIQRDVDGILTPPSWDQNEYITETEIVPWTSGSVTQNYTVTKSQTVITPEGTTYVYGKHGIYPNGMMNGRESNGTTEPTNILKINTVTDRHGNVTTYAYHTGNPATFIKSNGTVEEDRLDTITCAYTTAPNHVYEFHWNTANTRITKITENGTLGREIDYTYSTDGYLASVSTPEDRITEFTYEAPLNTPTGGTSAADFDRGASKFLTTITDPRGLQTKLYNVFTSRPLVPYGMSAGPGIDTVAILNPNRTFRVIGNSLFDLTSGNYGVGDAGVMNIMDIYMDMFNDRNDPQAQIANYLLINGASFDANGDMVMDGFSKDALLRVTMLSLEDESPQGKDFVKTEEYSWENLGSQGIGNNPMKTAVFSIATGHQVSAEQRTAIDDTKDLLITSKVNFLGKPLEQVEEEATATGTQIRRTSYAYWGRDKYYQQKAVVDPAGRVAWTDYYDKNAADGYKGQTKEVVRTGLDSAVSNSFVSGTTNLTASSYLSNSWPTGWRNTITPSANPVRSAKFDETPASYDDKGRVIRVQKLQKVVSGTAYYVTTTTTYGADGTTWWGNAEYVVEAQGASVNTERTTRTISYDAAGRTTESRDAKGRQFQTAYNLDGQIVSVTQVDNDGNPNTTFNPVGISSYEYGDVAGTASFGMITKATDDGQSEFTDIYYHANSTTSPWKNGQVSSVIQNGAATFASSYTYNSNGERELVTYTNTSADVPTAQMVRKFKYLDYQTFGSFTSPSRVFTKMVQMTSGSTPAETSEQFYYDYDFLGRLKQAEFASVYTGTTYARNETDRTKYARAIYDYDFGGRNIGITYDARIKVSNTWTTGLIKEVDYVYDLIKGQRTKFIHTAYLPDGNVDTAKSYTENYDYDANLDYLEGVDYDNNNSFEKTWTYDASANRKTRTGSSTSYVYDELNRMESGPDGTYTHDKVGNRLTMAYTGGSNSYQWDNLNRMTGFTKSYVYEGTPTANSITYNYRADGMRTQKIVDYSDAYTENNSSYYDFNQLKNDSTTRYGYDGQMCVDEVFTGTGKEGAEVVDLTRYALGARGIDMIEARRVFPTSGPYHLPDPGYSYPLYDGHGNMLSTLVKTSTGYALQNDKRCDAWGGILAEASGPGAGLVNPNEGYCANLGHKLDAESDLIYMRARYYEPGSGRFISEDRMAHGENWYAYCANDPVQFVDESGNSYTAAQAMHLLGSVLVAIGKFLMVDQFLDWGDAKSEALEILVSRMIQNAAGGDFESNLIIGTMVEASMKLLDIMKASKAAGRNMHAQAFQQFLGRNLVIMGLLLEIAAGTHGMDGVDFLDGGLGDPTDPIFGAIGL